MGDLEKGVGWVLPPYQLCLSAIIIAGTICLNSTVTLESLLCFFQNNLFVMPFDYLWHVLSTAIDYLTLFLLKILCNLLEWGKCFSIKFKNNFAMLVDTSKLNNGSNQMILHCCFLLTLFCSWLGGGGGGGYRLVLLCVHIFSVLLHILIWCC